MFTLTLNDVLSIIGAIAGVSAILISLYVLNKESLKIKVKHPTDDVDSSMVGFNIEYSDTETDDFGSPISAFSKYMILIWIQIANSSKSPTTILEMSLSIDGNSKCTITSRNQNDFRIASKYHIDSDDIIHVDSSYHYNSTKLPLFIPPYSAVEGLFHFNKLKLVENTPLKARLRIKTTQGSKRFKIILNPKFPVLNEKI